MAKYTGNKPDREVMVGEYDATPTTLTDGERGELQVDARGNLKTTQASVTTRVVTVGPVTYVGEAAVGSATSAAVWRVQKIDTTSGTVTTWADGDDLYDNVWDDYATLTYS